MLFLTLFSVESFAQKFGYIDSSGFSMQGDQKLQCELTIRDGVVVYDLNGISKTAWDAPAANTAQK